MKDVFKGTTRSIRYVYDFGDGWEDAVTLEDVTFVLADKLVVAGEGQCPAEDSGGVRLYCYRVLF